MEDDKKIELIMGWGLLNQLELFLMNHKNEKGFGLNQYERMTNGRLGLVIGKYLIDNDKYNEYGLTVFPLNKDKLKDGK